MSYHTSNPIHLPANALSRVTPKTRERAAQRGEAMEDGSFPIRDGADLRRAVQAYGRAKDKGAAKRHIIRRAKALDKVHLLPDDWRELASKSLVKMKPESQPQIFDALEAKVRRYNETAAEDRKVSTAKVRCVYNRGLATYTESSVLSAEQTAHARVNAFLRLMSEGKPDSPTYTADNDLLPVSHPALVAAAPPPFAPRRRTA